MELTPGTEEVSINGNITGGTTGSVLFVGPGSTIAQDNANFFWDDTNNRLGIGTNTPGSTFTLNSGQIELPIGTATAPSITFNGDLNTGIYAGSSSANPDTIGFTAGGARRLVVTTGGLVADNTMGPQMRSGATSGTVAAFIPNRTNSGTGLGSSGTDILSFITSSTEKMTILSGGNVGIGTTTPQSRLSVVSSGNDDGISWYNSTNGNILGRFGQENNTAGRMSLFLNGSLYTDFNTSGNSFIRAGTFTIGSNTLGTSKLNVSGNTSIGSTFYLVAAPTNGMIVEGNVGIGTTSPGATLHTVQQTLGSAVNILASTTTNDDPIETTFQNKVTTTNGTVTTLATIAIPASTTVMVEARVAARRTGGTSGTAEDGAGYIVTGVYKNVAGTATEIGETSMFSAEDQAGWACTINVSGSNALLQVTGAVDNNISWTTTYRVYPIST